MYLYTVFTDSSISWFVLRIRRISNAVTHGLDSKIERNMCLIVLKKTLGILFRFLGCTPNLFHRQSVVRLTPVKELVFLTPWKRIMCSASFERNLMSYMLCML
jgi:hypothetical protein